MIVDTEEIDLEQAKEELREETEASKASDTHSGDGTAELNAKIEQAEYAPKTDHIEIPDGGYGWVVVAAVFFVHIFVLGNIYSYGVFLPVYIEEFHASQSSVSWIGSIGASLMAGIGLLSGSLADYYGNDKIVFAGGLFIGAGFFAGSFATEIWHLYLSQGLLCGIGYSLSFIAGVSVVGQWFHKRRGIAVGIAVAGSGLGQFLVTLFTGYLINTVKWRATLQILALINLVGLLVCSLAVKRLLPLSPVFTLNASLQMFHDRNFVLLFIGGLFNSLGLFMPYTFLIYYSKQHGVSTSGAYLITALVGVASFLGRLATGYFADRFGKITMLGICMAASGISTLCWLACTTFPSLVVYGLIFGFFAGGVISLMPSVCAELFGVASLGAILGLLYSSSAVGNLLSAPIGGFITDATGDYTAAIAIDGCFLLSGVLFVFFIKTPTHQTHHPQHPQHEAVAVDDGGDKEVEKTSKEVELQVVQADDEQILDENIHL